MNTRAQPRHWVFVLFYIQLNLFVSATIIGGIAATLALFYTLVWQWTPTALIGAVGIVLILHALLFSDGTTPILYAHIGERLLARMPVKAERILRNYLVWRLVRLLKILAGCAILGVIVFAKFPPHIPPLFEPVWP